jgi:hypothetical protein
MTPETSNELEGINQGADSPMAALPEADKHLSLIEASCRYWFQDNGEVRNPFPESIQDELKEVAGQEYVQWLNNLTSEDRKEVGETELVEIFEQLLFSQALQLVGEEDPEQVLTIRFPFMPRVGDSVDDPAHGMSGITSRRLEQEDGEELRMIVELKSLDGDEPWQTVFVIPD